MKLLQQDAQDTTNAILLHMSSQLANNTMQAYQPSEFQVPQYAVVVNALFFTSLCCSLVAALAAVLALQWVNEYDARIDTVDSEKRAAIRHFRFVGVGTWKMAEIIAFLPLLLHSSVFLFFAGIIAWLRNIHFIVYWICVTGTAVTVMFYVITTALAATLGSSPFRSPMARVLRYVQFTAAFLAALILFILTESSRVVRWLEVFEYLRYTKNLETELAESDTRKLSVLIWTSDHVELAAQSTHRLLQILKHAIPLYFVGEEESTRITGPERRKLLYMETKFVERISSIYTEKAAVHDFSAADLEAIRVVLSSWNSPFLAEERRRWRKTIRDGGFIFWPSTLRLLGPFLPDISLQTAHLDVAIAVIQAMWLKNTEHAANQLVEVIQSIGVPSNPQEEALISYSIDCLSAFLMTRGPSHAHLHAANLLAEMIAVPPGGLFTNLKAAGTIGLTLSTIYSVAFNYSSQDVHQYWASGHRPYLASELGDKSSLVQALHSAVTSCIASEVAHATEVDAAYKSLQLLCRLMAYTPFETVCGANAARAGSIMKMMSYSHEWNGKRTISPAITSLIWLPKIGEIPRIHEYLEVLLSCRQRFPSLKPAWRNWGPQNRNGSPLDAIHNDVLIRRLGKEDRDWQDQLKSDCRIVDAFRAFDGLLGRHYSAAQHLVLVQLLIDDLSDEDVATDNSYYTDERKASLKALKDPVLRLIGSRAAKFAYSGPPPQLGDDGRHNASWGEALGYWCGQFEVVDAKLDEGFIVAVLSHPSPAFSSVLLRSSSQNAALQDNLRQILESRLNEPSDRNTTLLLHSVARTTSWFPEYLTPATLVKVMEILRSDTSLNPRLLPFLAFLVPFLSTTDDLKVITTTVQMTLLNTGPYLGQSEANEIYSDFEGILQDPPQWMQALHNSNFDQWREALESMRAILDIIRIQENLGRAVSRWNGRPHRVSVQVDGYLGIESPRNEVTPQEEGAGNQDHLRMWLERPYSCAASWDI